jgi:hypothetical protein
MRINKEHLIMSPPVFKMFVIFIIYLLANITYLLNVDGVYWDDWVAFNQEYSTLTLFYGQLQNTIHGYFSIVLLGIGNGVYGFRLALFVMYFISGLIIISILKTLKLFEGHGAYLIGGFYLISPIFHTKVAISIIPFYFSVFIFFVAWYWLSRSIESFSWKSRVGILVLFFVSFTTSSLLVFYSFVLCYLFYKQNLENYKKETSIFYKIEIFVRNNIEFILLPIVFFIFKKNYLQPNGLYTGYNQVKFANVDLFLSNLVTSVDLVIWQPLERAIISFWEIGLFVAVVICVIGLFSKAKGIITIKLESFTSALVIFVIGLVGIWLAVFPYYMVGKIPISTGWDSRFQLLTVLPVALFLYGSILICSICLSKLFSPLVRKDYTDLIFPSVLGFAMTILVSSSFYVQHRYNVDWFYQIGIEQKFIDSPTVKDNQTFIVVNNVQPSLAYSREFNYYEWNGLLKQAYGDDSRLMIPPYYQDRLPAVAENQIHKQYNFSTWKLTTPILVTIDYEARLDMLLIAKLYWYRIFDEKKFKYLAKKLVSVSYESI